MDQSTPETGEIISWRKIHTNTTFGQFRIGKHCFPPTLGSSCGICLARAASDTNQATFCPTLAKQTLLQEAQTNLSGMEKTLQGVPGVN